MRKSAHFEEKLPRTTGPFRFIAWPITRSMGGVVDTHPSRKKAQPDSKKEELLESQFKTVAEAFLELFQLLEEYAPIWYTEEHHNRAVAVRRLIKGQSPPRQRGASASGP